MQRLNTRQQKALKAFQVEGYEDEFRIVGVADTDEHVGEEHVEEDYTGVPDPAAMAVPSQPDSPLPSSQLLVAAIVTLFCAILVLALWRRNVGGNQLQHGKVTNASSLDGETELRNQASQDSQCCHQPTDGSNTVEDTRTDHEVGNDSSNKAEDPSNNFSANEKQDGPTLALEASPPDLLCDKNEDISRKAVSKHSSSESPTPYDLVPASQRSLEQVKAEFRSGILLNAEAFKEVLRESGVNTTDETITALSLQAAIAKHQTDILCQASFQSEMRAYQFHSRQQSIDHELSERQHEEVLSSLKGDKNWLSKLVRARNDCLLALKVSLARCYTLAIGIEPLFATMKLLHVWRHSSLSAMFSFIVEKVCHSCHRLCVARIIISDHSFSPALATVYNVSAAKYR